MSLLPAKAQPEGRLLVVGEDCVEAILVSVAMAREHDEPVSRVFYDSFGLGALAELPAFHGGRARTVVVGFPSADLGDEPHEVARALSAAPDMRWITSHAGTDEEGSGKVTVVTGDLLTAVAGELELGEASLSGLAAIGAEPPEELPEPEDASVELRWRYAIEAARSEPFSLGASTRGLVDGSSPDEDLVATGHSVVVEGRELARESSFHLFPVLGGQGVIVPAPRKASGFYVDVARHARRIRGCAVSVLFFDTHAPVIVEYERRPEDLVARVGLLASRLPEHVVRPFGPAGIAVKGPVAGSLDVLEPLIEAMSASIH